MPHDAPLHYLAGFTCGVQTGAGAILNAMPVNSASKVAIWGTGAVGLAAVMAAKASGAAELKGRQLPAGPPRPVNTPVNGGSESGKQPRKPLSGSPPAVLR